MYIVVNSIIIIVYHRSTKQKIYDKTSQQQPFGEKFTDRRVELPSITVRTVGSS